MQGEYRGDFTRDTFDPAKHFSRVLMQQGRVMLDGDWNEQTSILLHYLRTLATDLIGPHGGPGKIEGATNAGFLVGKRIQGGTEIKNDFSIQPGRYYVNGILCENDVDVAYTTQPDLPLKDPDKLKQNSSLVYLDVWERHITALEDSLIREVALGGPDTATRAQVMRQVKIDNLNEKSNSEIAQIKQAAADLLTAMSGANTNDKKSKAEAYLKVLVSKALQPASTGKLRARARKTDRPDEPCAISPESRYRGTENHLYRVEIHRSGAAWDKQLDDKGRPAGNIATAATFKWSRDNSSITFPIRSLGDGIVTLAYLGRDISSSLQVNDWVEIVDDDLVSRGEPGPLRQVESIDPVEISVRLKNAPGTLPPYDEKSPKHPLLRRWDFQGDSFEDKALTLEGGTGEDDKDWIALEDGIQVQFAAPALGGQPYTYRSGDYWLIPARVVTGDVEWPKEKDTTGTEVPKDIPPHGIVHHYAPLAVISVDPGGAVTLGIDCRRLLP